MITRHHVCLACGGTLILYLPLVFANPSILPIIVAGVFIGVVLPDIQMTRPRHFTALSPVWFIIQIFRWIVLRFYILIYNNIFGLRPAAEDKRLTHSLPGLFFITWIIILIFFLITGVFPSNPGLNYIRVFLTCIIIGLLFHFLEDTCTKKGLCPLYPLNETYRIAGSIRPCNRDDLRIRKFHIMTGVGIVAIGLLFYTGICPEYLHWLMSIGTLVVCTVIMLYYSEVKLTSNMLG